MNNKQAETIAAQASTIVALKEQVSALQADADRYRYLRAPDSDVALVIDKRTEWVPSDESIPGVGGYWVYEYRAGEELDSAVDAAIRAITSQPAAPVQPSIGQLLDAFSNIEHLWGLNEPGALVRHRDVFNMLIAAGKANAAPPVQQPGDVREAIKAISTRQAFEAWIRTTSEWEDDSDDFTLNADGKYNDMRWRNAYKAWEARDLFIASQALATTRPSSALTETQQRGLSALADRIEQAGNALPLFIDTTAAIAIRAILAASSGAVAVPEGWQPIETAPKDRKIDLWTGEARLTGCYWDRACGEWRKTDESGHIIRTRVATYWREIPAAPATPAQGQTK